MNDEKGTSERMVFYDEDGKPMSKESVECAFRTMIILDLANKKLGLPARYLHTLTQAAESGWREEVESAISDTIPNFVFGERKETPND